MNKAGTNLAIEIDEWLCFLARLLGISYLFRLGKEPKKGLATGVLLEIQQAGSERSKRKHRDCGLRRLV